MDQQQVASIIKSGGDWTLYKIPFIESNLNHFIYDLNVAHKNFKDIFVNVDSSLTRRQELTIGDLPTFLNRSENIDNFIESELNDSKANLSGYSFYNIFSLTSPSPYFYELFYIFRNIVRLHLGARPIWFQCWMNFHKSNEIGRAHV